MYGWKISGFSDSDRYSMIFQVYNRNVLFQSTIVLMSFFVGGNPASCPSETRSAALCCRKKKDVIFFCSGQKNETSRKHPIL